MDVEDVVGEVQDVCVFWTHLSVCLVSVTATTDDLKLSKPSVSRGSETEDENPILSKLRNEWKNARQTHRSVCLCLPFSVFILVHCCSVLLLRPLVLHCAVPRSRANSLRSCRMYIQFFWRAFWISTAAVYLTALFVCYMAGATWNCCRFGAFGVHHTTMHWPCQSRHFMQSHIRRAQISLGCNEHASFAKPSRRFEFYLPCILPTCLEVWNTGDIPLSRRRRTEKKEDEEEKKRLVSPVTVWALNWLSLSQRPLTPVTDQSSHKTTSIPPVNEHWRTKSIQTRQSNAAQIQANVFSRSVGYLQSIQPTLATAFSFPRSV